MANWRYQSFEDGKKIEAALERIASELKGQSQKWPLTEPRSHGARSLLQKLLELSKVLESTLSDASRNFG